MAELKPKVTLKEFVDDHQKIVAVMGVFVAMGLLWSVIGKTTGRIPFVTYLCFFITIPLFIQIAINWHRVNGDWLLRFFFEIFAGIFILTLMHLLTDFPEHFDTVLSHAIPFVFALGSFHLLQYTGRFLDFVWRDFIHIREKRRGRSIAEIVNAIDKRAPVIAKWRKATEITSSILGIIVLLSWILFGTEMRKFIIPSISVLTDRPIEKILPYE